MLYRKPRSNRDRTLAQWRGYWEPEDVSEYTQTLGTVVSKTMKGLGLKDRFHEEQVFEAWNELVDNFVAQNARPVSLERKVLHIQVLHPTIRYELDRMKGKILDVMQEKFGKENIREIKFRLG